MDGDHDLTRRALLRTGVAAGAATLLGGAAGGSAVAVPNDDYETTEGETKPRYKKGTPEDHYVKTEYTLPEAKGGVTESPILFGEIIWPVDGEGETKKDVPVILTYSPSLSTGQMISPNSVGDSVTPPFASGSVYPVST